MIKQDIDQLTRKYFASLPNTAMSRPKYIILFSGISGSGKSHIAHALERELHAIRVSNDDIRNLIVTTDQGISPAERENVKLQIATRLLDHLGHIPNGLVVFDVSCDRPSGYEFYHDWAQKHDFKTLLLRLDIPRELIEQRIRERGDIGYRMVERSLALLDTWWEQWEASGKWLEPDMIITPDTGLDAIVEKIRRMAEIK